MEHNKTGINCPQMPLNRSYQQKSLLQNLQKCRICHLNIANPGYSLCGSCHKNHKKQKTFQIVCMKCQTNAANSGHKLCETCYKQTFCTHCRKKPSNKGHSLCADCYRIKKSCSPQPTKSLSLCRKCYVRSSNPNHTLCDYCYGVTQQSRRDAKTKCSQQPTTGSRLIPRRLTFLEN